METGIITTAFVNEYASAFEHVLDQTDHMLEGTTREESQNGKYKIFNFIGATQGQWNMPRHSNSPLIDVPHSQRRCSMEHWTWSDLIDDVDVVQSLKDPQSDYLIEMGNSANRAQDEKLLQGMGAVVYCGENGDVSVNKYDAGECTMINGDGTQVTAGSDFSGTTETGLTLAKLALIGKIMDNNSVPSADRHIVCNVDQSWYMLGSAKTTNKDYATVSALTALSEGRIPNNFYMGFTFHFLPSDRFTVSTKDTGCYECYAYHKRAMVKTTGISLKTRVVEESGKNFSVRVWARMMIGSLRLQGKGVVPILLKKDPAADFTQA